MVLATTDAEVLVCPAMNTHMLHHPATQENLAALGARPRTSVLAPDAGALACQMKRRVDLPDAPVIDGRPRRSSALEKGLSPGGTSA